MRILGVDYGAQRTGLAVGDTETGLAFPLAVLKATDCAVLAAEILKVAQTEGCGKIVVGVPQRLTGDGQPGPTQCEAMAVVLNLSALTDLPIETEDERFTTAYAERLKREAGESVRGGADALAAALILETYMERMKE